WTLLGDRGSDPGSEQPQAGMPRQRRSAPVVKHQRHDFQLREDHQLHVPALDPQARRYLLHRYARGRDQWNATREAGLAEVGRQDHHHHREAWRIALRPGAAASLSRISSRARSALNAAAADEDFARRRLVPLAHEERNAAALRASNALYCTVES